MASGSSKIQVSNTTAAIINQGAGTVHVAGDVVVNPRSQTESHDFSLPRLIDTFRGRDEELAELERLFFDQKAKKVAICGLPGMGKSELAKQFAKRCEEKEQVENVFWVNAENEEGLKKSSRFLKDLYQSYQNSKCLFLFDNTVSRRSIFEYEPLKANHFLLITSQVGDWNSDVKPLRLSQLKPDCAIEVFRVILGELFSIRDRELYFKIAEIVNNIPLGLQVTAAYIHIRMEGTGQYFDLQEYVNEIRHYLYIDSKIPTNFANPYEKSLYGAIQISIDKLKVEENFQLRELALNALFVCAYLDPERIILDDLLQTPNIEQLLTKFKKNKNMLREALSLINKYSFINFDPNYPDIKIHRFVQEILRRHLRECAPGMQSACYGSSLEALFNHTRIRFRHDIILKFSDENIIIFYHFYRKHQDELFLNQDDKILKYILIKLIDWNCIKSFKKLLDNIFSHNLFNCIMYVRQRMRRISYTCSYINSFELMHHAAFNNNIDVMKLLMDIRFDIDSTDSNKDTPLHIAARHWSLQAIKFLVQHKPDIFAKNRWDKTPLFVFFDNAPRNEHTILDEVKEILNLFNIEQQIHTRKNDGDSLLHAASLRNNLGLMKFLIVEHNLQIDCKNHQQETPLHTAAKLWRFDSIKFLIQHKADVNATDCDGKTPLFKFITGARDLRPSKTEKVKESLCLLGCKNNDNNITNRFGDTLLHAAVKEANADIVTLLATCYNLDINAQNERCHYTPLHALIEDARWIRKPDNVIRTVEALKRCGARLDLTDGRGRTPRQLAEENEKTKYLLLYLTDSESASDN